MPAPTLLQIVPTLSSLIVPAGGVLQPGGAATLVGTGFRVGATKVEFSGAAPVAPDSLTRQVLTVTVPAELTAGSVRVRTNGGSSCWRSSAG